MIYPIFPDDDRDFFLIYYSAMLNCQNSFENCLVYETSFFMRGTMAVKRMIRKPKQKIEKYRRKGNNI
jgi:hypothetical protein